MDYERRTTVPPGEVLAKADELLPSRIELEKTKESDHGATFSGAEGTVSLSAHRHGPYTIVTATTNQLRTSRLDVEVQWFLNKLSYQAGDPPRER